MEIKELQGYVYWVLTIVLVVILYAYILHLYRSERRGEKDYEKYGRMAIDDELDSKPVEPFEKNKRD